jgi:hypothetical protein
VGDVELEVELTRFEVDVVVALSFPGRRELPVGFGESRTSSTPSANNLDIKVEEQEGRSTVGSTYNGILLSQSLYNLVPLIHSQPSNLPNLRRLFVEARTDIEESAYSRNAVLLRQMIQELIVVSDISYSSTTWFYSCPQSQLSVLQPSA